VGSPADVLARFAPVANRVAPESETARAVLGAKKTAQPRTRASALVPSVGGSHETLVRFVPRAPVRDVSSRTGGSRVFARRLPPHRHVASIVSIAATPAASQPRMA
jgi:hypothetical protein